MASIQSYSYRISTEDESLSLVFSQIEFSNELDMSWTQSTYEKEPQFLYYSGKMKMGFQKANQTEKTLGTLSYLNNLGLSHWKMWLTNGHVNHDINLNPIQYTYYIQYICSSIQYIIVITIN